MASGWKSLAERALVGCRAHRVSSARRAPSAVILAYHNVVPRGEAVAGDLSLHLGQDDFARQLDVLASSHEVVSLHEIQATRLEGPNRARVAITFDDAYRGALTAGLEELEARGMTATIMVAPGMLGGPGWWDLLAPEGGGPLNDDLRDHCLTALKGRHEDVMAFATREGLPLRDLPPHASLASEGEVVAAGERAGVQLAAHTWGHPNLSLLSRAECDREYEDCLEWLSSRTEKHLLWLAYPYGLVSETASAAAAARFDAAMLVSGGAVMVRGRTAAPRQLLPRLNIPRGVSLDGFRLRLSGVVGS